MRALGCHTKSQELTKSQIIYKLIDLVLKALEIKHNTRQNLQDSNCSTL